MEFDLHQIHRPLNARWRKLDGRAIRFEGLFFYTLVNSITPVLTERQ
jgi:hypothetical protein